MNYRHLALTLVAFFVLVGPPASVRADDVDQIIQEEMSQHRIPGLALAVDRGGETVKLKAYGTASIELAVPLQTDSVFQISSTTKIFTGVAIMQLVDDERLTLDDRIVDRLPDLPKRWSTITVHRLLSHTSGLPDVFVREGTFELRAPNSAGIVKAIAALPVDFDPGSDWRYNQAGFMLAGMLIEALTGQSFSDYCAALAKLHCTARVEYVRLTE